MVKKRLTTVGAVWALAGLRLVCFEVGIGFSAKVDEKGIVFRVELFSSEICALVFFEMME
jgi:hypothetical protein